MADPKIPPDIARKIAAMKAPAPAAAPKPAAQAATPAAPARAPASPGGWLGKVAALGWVLAVLAGVVAYFEVRMVDSKVADALAQQAAGYDQQIAALKADAAAKIAEGEARLRKANDDAAAGAASMQAELDYAKMPELPLNTQMRPGQVLYVENESDQVFTARVRMFRPVGAVTKEYDFSMKNRTYKDLAAIEDWVFQKGDTITFTKAGFKPRQLTVQ